MDDILGKLKTDGMLLKKIQKKQQTPEMCKVAIHQNPNALQYASKKCIDINICLDAVKRNGKLFIHVPDNFKTEEMCLLAVKTDSTLIENVPAKLRTKEICMISITDKLENLRYSTQELICEMLNKDGLLLKLIPKKEQTVEICNVAINQNPMALKYAAQKYVDEKTYLDAYKKDRNVFRYIPNRFKTKEMCWFAVNSDPYLLNKVPEDLKTKEICLVSITKEPSTFSFTPIDIRYEILSEDAPVELLKSIVEENIEWLEYMPNCKNGIDISMEYIKNDFYACQYLSMIMKSNSKILKYQKSQGKISIHRKSYNSEKEVFQVEIKVVYDVDTSIWLYDRVYEESYIVIAEFEDFDKFYTFLDGNLYDAELRTCKFEGINLKEYEIRGAIIHHKVLEEQGLYDGSYFEGIKKRIDLMDSIKMDKSEICIQKGFIYPKPVDDDGYEVYDNNQIPFFYISDIHLCHRVVNKFKYKATSDEARWYVKYLAEKMVESVGTVPDDSYLLIAGDTSSKFEYAKIFYEKLVSYWKPENIIVVHGNHELWDPWNEIESNIQFYREYFKEIGITFLQNDFLLVKERNQRLILSEEEILQLNEEELMELVKKCSIAILGGIGFSGLNDKYNAANMRYGKSFEEANSKEEALTRDRYEAYRFDSIYRKLIQAIPKKNVIVLTHMQKYDWNKEIHNPNWIYVNGHNHRNYFDISNEKIVYADNQIGYNTETLGLKYFYIDNEYDIFTYLEDGIHEITNDQYRDFNKGKLVQMSFKRDGGQIYIIKKNEKYMFFIYCSYSKQSKNKYIYLLNGGKLVKVERNRIDDLKYYYDNLDNYVKNINSFLDIYTGKQKYISNFIKRLGGSGKIHGCIVDIDKPSHFQSYSYCHIFVNLIDGKVTPYFANDIKSRIIYKDLKALLQSQKSCKILRDNYRRYEKEMKLNMPVIQYTAQLEEWGKSASIYDEGTYLYKISRIIRSLQYSTEKNIIRIWNEEWLNSDFVNQIQKANSIDDMINDTLIVNTNNE